LPFLPMTPIQVLLNNFLYDLSQTSIPTDQVDPEYLTTPRPWNIKSIQRYMFFIGPVSSIFDFTTFAVMLFIFKCTVATQDLFHTGWFIESLVSQTLVIYVIRTIKIPVTESRPSRFLVFTSLLIIAFGIILPFTPFAAGFGFARPSAKYFIILEGMIAAYLFMVYFVQQWFVKKFGRD
jgi:P-type Mg2+ transporter